MAQDKKSRPAVEPHHCNVVPAEMHTRMIDERDKKIAELQGQLIAKLIDVPILDGPKKCDCEICKPQPPQEGYNWILFNIGMGIVGLIVLPILIWATWEYAEPKGPYISNPSVIQSAAPKGTGDDVNISAMEQNYVKIESDAWVLQKERDHWLRNCKKAWRMANCDSLDFKMTPICQVLDQ